MVVPKMDRVHRIPQTVTEWRQNVIIAAACDSGDAYFARGRGAVPEQGFGGDENARPRRAIYKCCSSMRLARHTPAEKPVNEGRELLLSKITKSLRNRAQEAAL